MLRSLCISLFAWSVLGAGSALAAQAVTSADMTLRQGPGDHYKHLATIVAGSQVDLRECDEAN